MERLGTAALALTLLNTACEKPADPLACHVLSVNTDIQGRATGIADVDFANLGSRVQADFSNEHLVGQMDCPSVLPETQASFHWEDYNLNDPEVDLRVQLDGYSEQIPVHIESHSPLEIPEGTLAEKAEEIRREIDRLMIAGMKE
jgi:hypothetical protein